MAMRRLWKWILALGSGVCFVALGVLLWKNIQWDLGVGVATAGVSKDTQVQYVQSLTPAQVSFPCAVPGTPLFARHLVRYDGAFMENGSDREVMDVMSLMLENPTQQAIAKAWVVLQWDQEQFVFEAVHIPPDSQVLVLEKNGKKLLQRNYTGIRGGYEQGEDFHEEIQIWEEAPGTLYVKNLSDAPITQIQIFHKSYYPQPGFYLGGISYETKTPYLAPGQTAKLYPHHYAVGSSKVVWFSYNG